MKTQPSLLTEVGPAMQRWLCENVLTKYTGYGGHALISM
jgi:hypothetical protein